MDVAGVVAVTLRVLLALQIQQPTVSDRLLLILCMPVTVLIHFGTIFWVLVTNERVSLDVCDTRTVKEEFGVFDEWYIGFLSNQIMRHCNKNTRIVTPPWNEREIKQFSYGELFR